MKKMLNTLLSIIVAITIMVQPMSHVYSETNIDLQDYIKSFGINVDGQDITGNEWDVDIKDYVDGGQIFLKYGFEFPNELQFEIEKPYKLTLPESFVAYDEKNNSHSFMMEINGIPEEVGNYTINEDGTISIVFSKPSVNEADQRKLNLDLRVNLDADDFEDGEDVEVNVDFGESGSYSLVIKPKNHEFGDSDTKTGSLFKYDENGNKVITNEKPTHASYSVKVNSKHEKFESVKVVDSFDNNQTLVDDSLKIWKINYNKITGAEISRVDVTNDYLDKLNVLEHGFEIDFETMNTEYIIEYNTQLSTKEFGTTEFKNHAQVVFEDYSTKDIGEEELTGKWGTNNPPVEKTGVVSGDIITWTVHYNFNGEKVADENGKITLIDTFNVGNYVDGSFTIKSVNVDVDGNPTDKETIGTDKYSLTPTDKKLKIELTDLDETALVFTYKTRVDANVKGEVTNEIIDNNGKKDKETVEVDTTPNLNKVGTLVYVDGIPYVDWVITINTQKYNVTEAIDVTDAFDATLMTLDQNSIVVEKDGDVITEGYNVINQSNSGFDLKIAKPAGPHEYTIKYRTEYTDAGLIKNKDNIKNNADVNTGDGVKGIGPASPNEKPEPGLTKSGKYVVSTTDPKVDQIEWTVKFNTNKLILSKPILTDTFSPATIELIGGSLVITKTSEPETLVLGTDYTLDNNGTSGFVVKFLDGTLAEEYTMTYRTTVNAANVDQENIATITDLKGLTSNDDATVERRVVGGGKSQELKIREDGTKYVDYQISFNSNKYAVDKFILKDTLTLVTNDNQILIPDSSNYGNFELKYGDGDKGRVAPTLYTLSDVVDGVFTLKFNGKTEQRPYVLSYTLDYPIEYQNVTVKNVAGYTYTGSEIHEFNTREVKPLDLKVEKASTNLDKTEVPYKITWEIQANVNANELYRVDLKDATLTDVIELDQKYVDGSIKLYRATRNSSNALERDHEIDLVEGSNITWSDVAEGKQFVINLDDDDGLHEYIVEFATHAVVYTSLDPVKGYHNKVTLTNETVRGETEETKHLKKSQDADAYRKLFEGEDNNNSTKFGKQDPETDEINWEVVINKHAMPIRNARLEDELDVYQSYVKKTLKVEAEVEGNWFEILENDYTVEWPMKDGKETFVLRFLERTTDPKEVADGISYKYRIIYNTTLNDNFYGSKEVTNKFALFGDNGRKIDDTDSDSSSAEKWYSSASGSGVQAFLDIEKLDYDNHEKPLANVVFALYRVLNGEEYLVSDEVITDINGLAHVEKLRSGRYILKEVTPKFGYQSIPGDGIKLIIKYDSKDNPYVDINDSTWSSNLGDLIISEGAKLTVLNKKDVEAPETTEITITKKWIDGNNVGNHRPDSITINVLANGEVYETLVLDSTTFTGNVWTYTAEDLPKYDENDVEIVYTISEEAVAGYATTYSEDTLEITNEFILPKGPIEGTKTWNGGSATDKHQDIVLQLFRDGEKFEEPVTLEAGKSNYVWEDLELEDYKGKKYVFTVEEVNPPVDYTPSYDGMNITNTYNSPLIDVTVTKEWVHGSTLERPTVHFKLYRTINKDAKLGHVDVFEVPEIEADILTIEKGFGDEMTGTWDKKLPEKDFDGNLYYYLAEEVNEDGTPFVPENYGVEYDGTTVINTYSSPTRKVEAKKIWVDGDTLERPVVNFKLYRTTDVDAVISDEGVNYVEGTDILEVVTPKGETEVTVTWTELDTTDEEGKTYHYHVEEVNKDGEPLELENYVSEQDGLEVKNTYVIPTGEISAKKTWVGGSEKDKLQDITLQLLQDGEPHDEPVLLEAGTYTYTWGSLELTDITGREYVYTVVELDVPENYNVSYSGLEITNTYVSPLTSKSVKKIWVEGPVEKDPIEVQLYRNGKPHLEPVTLDGTEEDAWIYTWDKLDLNDHNGVEYVYSVQEVTEVENFGVEYSEVDDIFVITNTFESPVTSVIGRKSWVNGPSVKPDVTLQLLRNGEPHLEPVVLKSGEYEYIWLDLDALDNIGEPYVYTVEEVDIPENYVASYDGMNVTNTYVIPLTDITVEKIWIHEVKESPTIGIQLYRNGEAYGDIVRLENGMNTYTWKDLDLTDEAGIEYIYTVDEVEVPLGYHKDVHGFTITNTFDEGLLGEIVPKPDDKLPVTGAVSLASIATGTLFVSGLFFVLSKKRKED